MNKALEDIAAERRRQIEDEGWTPEHDDDEHGDGDLARAAASYAYLAGIDREDADAHRNACHEHPHGMLSIVRVMWPWLEYWLKVGPNRRMLAKAVAWIVAAIDQIDRQDAADKAERLRIVKAS